MPEKVLVTGGSGMIGTYVMRQLLRDGHRVANLDVRDLPASGRHILTSGGVRPDDADYFEGSVDSWGDIVAAVKRYQPAAIIHIAAVVNPALLARKPALSVAVNFQGTVNMLEAARQFGVGRFVYASSIAVLPGIRYEPVDVDHPIFLATEGPGASFYSAAKVAGEAYCWAYHQSFGTDIIIVRPSAVYGFGMQHPIYMKPIVENAVRGVPTRFASGAEFPRDYTHAMDVAQLLVRAATVDGESVHDRVFYAATGEKLQTPADIRAAVLSEIPDAEIDIGSGLSEEDRLEIRYRGIIDISNAREQLGFEPQYCDLSRGVKQYIEMYRDFLSQPEAQSERDR